MTATASNPLREGMSLRRAVDSAVIVVLGATGDLAGRKLMPALFNLARAGHLPARYAVVGYARRPKTDAEYRADTVAALHEFSRTKPTAEEAEAFLAHVYYQQGNLDDAGHYAGLRERIEALEAQLGLSGNRLVYFAISPEHFGSAIDLLHTQRVIEPHREGPMHRIVVEKPFGEDVESARRLNREILSRFVERQVFRIDHYLGKETVQNILAFRFANSIFEPLWTSRYVESVQITVAEDVGMPGRRGQYFDKAGILRDIVQNHALQLLCLVAMEPPASLDAESLRDEKVRLLRAIPVMAPEEVRRHVVRGQYGAGSLMGKAVAGYREEEAVARDSVTETYVALRLQVRNWRWAGVPFLLRSGKRLPKRATEIAVVFKEPPHQIFRDVRIAPIQNTLIIRIQPDEGISLSFDAKRPGLSMELQPVMMDFRYGSSFGSPSPEAYERLLLEALAGDGSLFTRADEIELAWERISAIHETWNGDAPPADFPNYEAGTWGPADAERLVADLSHKWRRL